MVLRVRVSTSLVVTVNLCVMCVGGAGWGREGSVLIVGVKRYIGECVGTAQGQEVRVLGGLGGHDASHGV